MIANKVRLYPTADQIAFLERQFGSVRFVYNKALAIMNNRFRKHGEKLSPMYDISKLLPIAKKSRKYGWLKEADSQSLVKACNNLEDAFKRFYKKTSKYPTFKSRRGKQSSHHYGSNVFVTDDNRIKIPKLTAIKCRGLRPIDGKLKSITISKTGSGKYYASLLYDDGRMPNPISEVSNVIGIDLGLAHFAITSNGEHIDNPKHLQKASRNLKRKQQSLSRKMKGSARRSKARLLLAKAHERVANCRSDYHHKLSRMIVDENQAVIVETLKSSNMMKNRSLAKSIGDAGWFGFVTMLEYKCRSEGKHMVKIDQWFPSSKTCSSCGHKLNVLPLSVRKWDCPHCGLSHDRDINAAINIKFQGIVSLMAGGVSVTARGDHVRPFS